MNYLSPLFIFSTLCISQAQNPFVFEHKQEFLGYQRYSDVETGPTSINPNNTVADLSQNLLSLNLRGDFKAKWGWLEGSWGPRGLINATLSDFNTEARRLGYFNWELYSQFAKLKTSFGQHLYVIGGRYRTDWGPSTFVNPSNPFVIETGRVNPKIEAPPRDFIQVNYALDSWELGLIANVGPGEESFFRSPFFTFSRTYAAILDYYGQSQNLSFILSGDESGHRRVAGYGQKSLSNSVVTWVDASLEQGIHLFIPSQDTSLIRWKMEDDENRNAELFHAAVAGLSYTTMLGPTISMEYYRNDKGYDQNEAKRYYDMIAGSAAYRFDLLALLGRRNLGRAINVGQPFLRRNYLFFQVGQTDVWSQFDYNVRYIQNLDDGGGQISSVCEWNLANRWQIFLVGLLGGGDSHTEFGRFLNGQLMTGFIFRT